MNVNIIDQAKWDFCKRKYNFSQKDAYEAIGMNKGSFWARMNTGAKFSDDEIKIICDKFKLDPSMFLIDSSISTANEPITNYAMTKDEKIAWLESRLKDKEKIIELLESQIGNRKERITGSE